jgi:starvation-inducible DNA-binding protein
VRLAQPGLAEAADPPAAADTPEAGPWVREICGATLRSIGQIAKLRRIADNDARHAGRTSGGQSAACGLLVRIHGVCNEHGDVASASLLETWIDEVASRTGNVGS